MEKYHNNNNNNRHIDKEDYEIMNELLNFIISSVKDIVMDYYLPQIVNDDEICKYSLPFAKNILRGCCQLVDACIKNNKIYIATDHCSIKIIDIIGNFINDFYLEHPSIEYCSKPTTFKTNKNMLKCDGIKIDKNKELYGSILFCKNRNEILLYLEK